MNNNNQILEKKKVMSWFEIEFRNHLNPELRKGDVEFISYPTQRGFRYFIHADADYEGGTKLLVQMYSKILIKFCKIMIANQSSDTRFRETVHDIQNLYLPVVSKGSQDEAKRIYYAINIACLKIPTEAAYLIYKGNVKLHICICDIESMYDDNQLNFYRQVGFRRFVSTIS